MGEKWLFLKKMWRFWQVNLTGGSFIALLILVQVFVRSVPLWVYAGIAVATLVISCFLAWRDEYRNGLVLAGRCAEAERQLADEKANKLSVDEIVMRESRSHFRHLTKIQDYATAPRRIMNQAWIEVVAKEYGKTPAEISDAIDRLDGKFHWQP